MFHESPCARESKIMSSQIVRFSPESPRQTRPRAPWWQVLCACLLLALPATAKAPKVRSRNARVRVTTRLVEVSVVAETKKGEPVTDLTKEDFTLLDGGRPEQITVFDTASSQQSLSGGRRLPDNMFSNHRNQFAGNQVSATVILFDGLNTQITDRDYARRQIVKFLKQMRPEDRVALYVLGRGPRVLQDFTSDPKVLLKALASYDSSKQIAGSLDSPLYDPALSPTAQLDAWLGELSFNLYQHYSSVRAFRTVRTLVAIANHLQRLPGRKNLLWVAGSFPLYVGIDTAPEPKRKKKKKKSNGEKIDVVVPELYRLARALNDANMAIYPVDARGLIAPQQYRADHAALGPRTQERDQAMFSVMRVLAERTGGRAFYNNNDLSAALQRATKDARISYVLAYYPSHGEWNNKFRPIKLKVNRPGVKLLYRNGYFAQPEEPKESWYREEVLDAAIWSPMEATGLGLTVRVRPAGKRALDLDFMIDAADITMTPKPKEEVWLCGLDLWMVQLDASERPVKTTGTTNNLRLTKPIYEQVQKVKGLRLVERLKPVSGATLVRVLVRDISSGRLGSVTIPLKRFLQQAD